MNENVWLAEKDREEQFDIVVQLKVIASKRPQENGSLHFSSDFCMSLYIFHFAISSERF